jgi:hypothetical protein
MMTQLRSPGLRVSFVGMVSEARHVLHPSRVSELVQDQVVDVVRYAADSRAAILAVVNRSDFLGRAPKAADAEATSMAQQCRTYYVWIPRSRYMRSRTSRSMSG